MVRRSKPLRWPSGRHITLTGALFAASLAVAPAPAQAQPPGARAFAAIEALGAPVPDRELSDIRGKFIRPDSVSFFGVAMVTSWQDDRGIITSARLVFNVDFLNLGNNGRPVPQLMIGWVREGDPAMDVSDTHSGYAPYLVTEQVLPVGGLGGTSGAAQANIIAGSDNAARNSMQVALVPTSLLHTLNVSGLLPVSSTTVQGFADGDQVEFRLGANELGLIMTGNAGRDSTLQSIGGDLGSLLQQTVLNSDGNAVFNNSTIVIGTETGTATFDAIRAANALSAMKGNGF